MNVTNIKTKDITTDPKQPRKFFDKEALDRLAQSIKDVGIEHPLIVRKNGKSYIVVEGERRLKCAQRHKLETVPCLVTDKSNEDEVLEIHLRADCLKEGLTVDELDRAVYRYYEHMMGTSSHHPKQVKKGTNPYRAMIARKIGKSEKRVSIAIDRFEFKAPLSKIKDLSDLGAPR